MALQISDFWTWRGTVGRGKYFAIGVTLFAIKHLLDRIVATKVFGVRWTLFNYLMPGEATEIDHTPLGHLKFYATLVALALPFIWVGVVLTLRRLRDIGWPLWLVVVFFFPFVNLLFFLLLSTIPSHERSPHAPRLPGLKAILNRVIPRSSFGSATVGIIITALLTIGITVLALVLCLFMATTSRDLWANAYWFRCCR